MTSHQQGFLLATLAAFGFSLKAIFVKLAYGAGEIDAITLLALRMAFSLPLFLVVGMSALRHGPTLTAKDWLLVSAVGLAGYYGASILDFMGLQYISAGLERLILFTYPAMTVLLAVIFLGKQLHRRLVLSLVLCSAGVMIASAGDLQFSDSTGDVWLGVGLVFGSALSYACYNAFSEVAVKKLGSRKVSLLAMLVSIAAVQLHFVLSSPLSGLAQPMSVYGYAMAMALFATVIPVFLQASAIRHIGAADTALVGTLGPVITIALGWVILSEPLSAAQIGGTALVIAGVLAIKRNTTG
ncbi:DMT family transporter [Alteromonas sp. AMM-1]|uniref:DMT family transporter n=1 Tax=Alteromonas sp. AMM-1 TaxID=3394233 RepID=UPI0039A52F4E